MSRSPRTGHTARSFPGRLAGALVAAGLFIGAGVPVRAGAVPAVMPPGAAASSTVASPAVTAPTAATAAPVAAKAPAAVHPHAHPHPHPPQRRTSRHAGTHRPARTHTSRDAPGVFAYGRRADVLAFAREVARDRLLDPGWVETQLARARFQPAVTRLVMPAPAGTAKNWAVYRARFVEPARVRAGVRWWQAHAQTLEAAQARYGVPPEVVVGIVGVETYYGRLTGHFRVLDALATLAFDFPAGRSDRSAFYREQLAAWLAWCAREHQDADQALGSFAGAVGWPQFMPGSLFRYAVDFDGDGRIDLDAGGPDVIGSIANYLAAFGWQRGLPATYAALPPAEAASRARLLAPDIRPTFTAAQMVASGALLPDAALRHDGPLALVQLQNGDEPPSFVAGTANFYVVTRYNWSAYYAMAVLELGRAVRDARGLATAAEGR